MTELNVSYPASWEEWVSRVNYLVELSPLCMDYSTGSKKYKIVFDYTPRKDIVSQIRYKHMMYQIFISDRPRDRERIIAFSNQIRFNSMEIKYNQQISSAITTYNKTKENIKKHVPKKRSQRSQLHRLKKSKDDNTLLQPPLLSTPPDDCIQDIIKSKNTTSHQTPYESRSIHAWV